MWECLRSFLTSTLTGGNLTMKPQCFLYIQRWVDFFLIDSTHWSLKWPVRCCFRPQDLADDLSSELSGNFQSVVLGLLMLAPVYDAYELKNAVKVWVKSSCSDQRFKQVLQPDFLFSFVLFLSCATVVEARHSWVHKSHLRFLFPFFLWQGAGTEEACLIDILASRSNDEIKAINAFYKKSEWLHVYE